MEQDDILDQQQRPVQRFNKNPLLYGLVTLCLLGFLMDRMHWPGYSLFIIFGGGISVGYVLALLVYFRQHFFFENAGFILYASFITFSVMSSFVVQGWMMYAGALAVTMAISVYLLHGREIV